MAEKYWLPRIISWFCGSFI